MLFRAGFLVKRSRVVGRAFQRQPQIASIDRGPIPVEQSPRRHEPSMTLLVVAFLLVVLDRFLVDVECELFRAAFGTVFEVGEKSLVGEVERV